jgi:DNA-binding NtrC family response regulator
MPAGQHSRVLLIEDDPDMRWAMRNILAGAGFDVAEADLGRAGLEMARNQTPDTVLLDMQMPSLGGEEVLRRLRCFDPGLPVIVVTAYGSIAGAISAIREGAFDYITKPFRNEHLVESVRRAIMRRSAHRVSVTSVSAAIMAKMGQSLQIRNLIGQIEAVVSSDYSVIIQGETGTGKEVIAATLHQYSRRAASPLVVVDCGAVVESLTDSEFFGHEKGAFTGASERRRGCFEAAANSGTIFLDEIGNLAATGQKALLRVLEEHKIRRLGGTETINLDIRVLAATNDNLQERAKAGTFREDLFFRLAEYTITVPPLRSRVDDIEFLARCFLTHARAALGRPPVEITSSALDVLRAYHWPGNVRELRNIMRRAALTKADEITPCQLGDSFSDASTVQCCARESDTGPASLRHRVQDQIRVIERDAVFAALEQAGGNKAKAARLLGIDYKTYRTKLKVLKESQNGATNGGS